MKLRSVIIYPFVLLLIHCSRSDLENQKSRLVNFNHLEHLTETIELNGQECDIIHIYSEYPDYHWVDAAEEGIACVDDVARAAVVYLRYFEIAGIDSILLKAKRLLNFVLYMQAEDGEFYNFIGANYQINKTYRTSKKSFDFWAARGYWAIGLGYRIFKDKDREYAVKLKDAFLKCKIPIKKNLEFYKQYIEINGRKYPLWLVNKYGSDATATLLLGLNEFLKIEQDQELEKYASQLVEGIIEMQVEDGNVYPGAFLSWQDIWHAWGNAQTQALTSLGKTLNQSQFIQAAKKEADKFYSNMLIHGMLREWKLGNENKAEEFPQISYGIRCMTLGLLRLSEATGNEDYAKLAGLAASWLMGNNAAKTQMYDPKSGRCFDGIIDSTKVNFNSGAESTIEALYTLTEISSHPIAKKYLFYHTMAKGSISNKSPGRKIAYREFQNDAGNKILLVRDFDQQKFEILEDDRLAEFLEKYGLK